MLDNVAKIVVVVCIVGLLGLVGGIFLQMSKKAKVSQKENGKLCYVSNVASAFQKCQNGDTVLFAPSVFGNEQLPVIAAAGFCDFSRPIVWNKGGVSCIFTDKRKKEFLEIIK